MSIRNIIYLIFSVLTVAPAFSQANELTNTAEKTTMGEATTRTDHRLPIVNPLFAPYQGQWFVQVDATEQRSAFTATIPAQSYSGFSFAESKSRTDYTDIRVGGQVFYGIHDRISVGIRTLFLADRQTQTVSTGAFTSQAPPLPTSTGMYNPDFVLQGRLLGVNQNEWHLNLIGIYSPGSIGGLSAPPSNLLAGLLIGRNAGFLTFGLAALAIWSPETTVSTMRYRSTTAISGEMVLQAHFSPYFFNLLGGATQYVDPSSANDAMSGKVRLVWAAEIGAEVQQNVFAKISYGWRMPVSADFNSGGLQVVYRDHGGPAANLTIGMRF
jgi:hypothetical protein